MNIIAIDIETTDLDPRKGKIMVMKSWPETLPLPSYIEGDKVFHNCFFDVPYIRKGYELYQGDIYDTWVMHHLIEEDVQREKGGLKELAKIYLDRDINPFKGGKNKLKTILEMTEEERNKYCLEDARATYDLFFIFKKKMEENGTWKLYKEIVRPFCEVLIDAKVRGIRVDVEYFKKLQKNYIQKINNLTTELDKLCKNECYNVMSKQLQIDKEKHLAKLKTEKGKKNAAKGYLFPKMFNWDSNRLIGRLLFDEFNLPFGKRTPKAGQKKENGEILNDYIVDEEVLNTLKDRHKAVEFILERRSFCKLKRTYIDGIIELAHDGFIHPNLVPLTVTGRCKASEPNIQNIPREGPINRGLIPRDRYKFIKADYAQLELRIAAGLSNDPQFCKIFCRNGDPHMTTAKTLGIDRQRAKTVNFALLYGAGPWNLAIQLGYTNLASMQIYKKNHILKIMRKYIDTFFTTYRGVKRLLDDAKRVAIEEGEVKNIFGRIRHLPYAGEKKEVTHIDKTKGQKKVEVWDEYTPRAFAQQREAANFVVQSTAHDVVSRAIVRGATKLEKLRVAFLAEQHDALIYECPTDVITEAKEVIQKNLKEDFFGVPLLAEAKILNSFDEGDVYGDRR